MPGAIMDEAVERLREIMSPPPEGGDVIDWEGEESESGVRLPADYRDFVAVYGGGLINRYLQIHTPRVLGSLICGALSWPPAERGDSDLEWLQRTAPGADPLRLLQFGATDDGDELLWVRSGTSPEDWPVLVFLRDPLRDNPWTLFNGGMARFVLALVSGELTAPPPFDSPIFPGNPPTYMGWRAWNARIGYEGP